MPIRSRTSTSNEVLWSSSAIRLSRRLSTARCVHATWGPSSSSLAIVEVPMYSANWTGLFWIARLRPFASFLILLANTSRSPMALLTSLLNACESWHRANRKETTSQRIPSLSTRTTTTARLCLNHNSYLIPFRAILFRRALSLFFLDYASFLRLRLSFFIFLDISRTLTFTFERVLPLKVHASWSMMSFALMAAPHSFFFASMPWGQDFFVSVGRRRAETLNHRPRIAKEPPRA